MVLMKKVLYFENLQLSLVAYNGFVKFHYHSVFSLKLKSYKSWKKYLEIFFTFSIFSFITGETELN